jgi:hypothetical protein
MELWSAKCAEASSTSMMAEPFNLTKKSVIPTAPIKEAWQLERL